jgi:hypothetical protein
VGNGLPLSAADALATDRPWARLALAGAGELVGDVVEFGDGRLVVALDHAATAMVGRAVVLTLGVGRDQEGGLWAMITEAGTTTDGRACLTVRVVDGRGGGRRDVARVPFAAKVEVLVVSSRTNTEPRLRGSAIDLSTGGMALRLERDLPPGATLLLRFPVPPNRGATVQVRATVVSCRAADDEWLHCVAFDRVSGTVAQQLQAAVRAISDAF